MGRTPQTSALRPSTLALVCLGVVLALATTGCARAGSGRAAPAPGEAELPVTRMGPEEVRTRIATSFPAELPVAQGEVVTGRAQGPDAWDYQLVVAAPVKTVALWYSDQYERRGWVLSEGRITGEVVRLTLRKGAGESQITLKPAKEATRTAVTGIASVGVPVIEAQ